MGKGLRKGIKQSTHARADKKLGRVFVDSSGPTVVEYLGKTWYTLIVRDDFLGIRAVSYTHLTLPTNREV